MTLGTNKTATEFGERDFLYTFTFLLGVCGLNVHTVYDKTYQIQSSLSREEDAGK